MQSKQWGKLTKEQFSDVNEEFLTTFRRPGQANKFVAWDPYEKSTRYFKFLLYKVASSMGDAFFDGYSRLSNVDLGDPLCITYKGCKVNADYLAAIEEWEFLRRNKVFDSAKSIVEVGGGFGRTCHALMSLEQLESYTIVDLDPMLKLSKAYLGKVLPQELFSRVAFVSNCDYEMQKSLKPDLSINIDSFQEMPAEVIDGYVNRIINNGMFFYSKNAVGKYAPSCVGLADLSEEKMQDVFDLGKCRTLVDVFDDNCISNATKVYLQKYLPMSSAENIKWHLVDSSPMSLFPYFVHAIYRKVAND